MKGKCKLCLEKRELFMDGMCSLCFKYLQDRVFRLCNETLDKVMKDSTGEKEK